MRRILVLLSICLSSIALRAEQPRVVILGDSITWDGRWVARVESALRSTSTYANATILNLGLPSETASGLSEPGHAGGTFPRPCIHDRLGAVLTQTKPTLVIACYGMNDGIYQPFNPEILTAYKKGMEKLVSVIQAKGARCIIITPPLHAPDKTKTSPQDYDNVLETFSGWLNSKTAMGWEVIDIRPGLRDAIQLARKQNKNFQYSTDQVHPGDAGHRMIAEAALLDLWKLLKLKDKPEAGSDARIQTYLKAQTYLRDAWLSQTGHKRPGLPKGIAMKEAEIKAAGLRAEAAKLK
jgi:lysophospholipase L1-like esterase